MGTPADYTIVANALAAEVNAKINTLDLWKQQMIRQYLTPQRIVEVANDGARVAVDTLDAHRAKILQEH